MRSLAALAIVAGAALGGCAAKRDAGPAEVHSEAKAPMTMKVDLDLLQDWSRRLCNVSANDVGEVAAALGIPGSVVQRGNDAVTIEPPLAGAKQIELGRRKGAFTRVAVALADSRLTRADFDKRFGAGNLLPRVGAGRAYEIAYEVAVPGAQYTCAVFATIASFDEPPNDASVVTEVTLRRDRISP